MERTLIDKFVGAVEQLAQLCALVECISWQSIKLRMFRSKWDCTAKMNGSLVFRFFLRRTRIIKRSQTFNFRFGIPRHNHLLLEIPYFRPDWPSKQISVSYFLMRHKSSWHFCPHSVISFPSTIYKPPRILVKVRQHSLLNLDRPQRANLP